MPRKAKMDAVVEVLVEKATKPKAKRVRRKSAEGMEVKEDVYKMEDPTKKAEKKELKKDEKKVKEVKKEMKEIVPAKMRKPRSDKGKKRMKKEEGMKEGEGKY